MYIVSQNGFSYMHKKGTKCRAAATCVPPGSKEEQSQIQGYVGVKMLGHTELVES